MGQNTPLILYDLLGLNVLVIRNNYQQSIKKKHNSNSRNMIWGISIPVREEQPLGQLTQYLLHYHYRWH